MYPRVWLFVFSVFTTLLCVGCDSTLLPERPARHPMVGQPAPLFTGATLDEQPFDLARLIGRDVIILDFWSTWCGPCTRSLPTIAEVAAEYEERGVQFFAVDIGETPEEVRQFLDSTSLDLQVVMDYDGAISDLYAVRGIPHTAIIGLDGTVRYVHIGASKNLRAELTRELDKLVAGS